MTSIRPGYLFLKRREKNTPKRCPPDVIKTMTNQTWILDVDIGYLISTLILCKHPDYPSDIQSIQAISRDTQRYLMISGDICHPRHQSTSSTFIIQPRHPNVTCHMSDIQHLDKSPSSQMLDIRAPECQMTSRYQIGKP